MLGEVANAFNLEFGRVTETKRLKAQTTLGYRAGHCLKHKKQRKELEFSSILKTLILRYNLFHHTGFKTIHSLSPLFQPQEC